MSSADSTAGGRPPRRLARPATTRSVRPAPISTCSSATRRSTRLAAPSRTVPTCARSTAQIEAPGTATGFTVFTVTSASHLVACRVQKARKPKLVILMDRNEPGRPSLGATCLDVDVITSEVPVFPEHDQVIYT